MTGEMRLFLRDLPDHAEGLAWSPEGRFLAAATLGDRGDVLVLDGERGDLLWREAGHEGGASAIAWSPDGKRLASTGHDGVLCVRDGGTGEERWSTPPTRGWEAHLRWSPDGKYLASTIGNRLRIHGLDGAEIEEFERLPGAANDMLWHPKIPRILVASRKGIHWFEPGKYKPVREYPCPGAALSMCLRPGQQWLAVGCQDKSIFCWDVADATPLCMGGYAAPPRCLQWTENLLATAGGTKVNLWDFSGKGPAGSRPRSLAGHTSLITGLRAVRNSWLFSISLTGELIAWDRAEGWKPWLADELDAPFHNLVLSPDGLKMAASVEGGAVLGWSMRPLLS
jgi:WD40 repeat protein